MDAMDYPFSERGKPGIETQLVDPDAGADAQHPEISGAVAQIVGGTGGDGQQLGDLLHPVNKGFEPGCLRSGLRFRGRGLGHFYCTGFGGVVQGFGGGKIAGLNFFQKHLLFRSTAWLMGVISLQSPKCGIGEADTALLQSRPLNFFCAEYRNTRPSRPPAPNAPSRAGSWAGGAVFEKNEAKEIKRQYDLFFADVGERARGAGNFHFPPQFYSRAQSGRTYTPR